MPGHTNGHTNGGVLRTQANQFRNRRTGILVPAGVPYHIHPDRGPMQGAQHNPNIPGGTSGHDFFDTVSGANTTSGMSTGMSTRMSTRSQRASSRSTMGGSGGGYRRGGRTRGRRRFEHGGMHSCPPGQMMQNGGCVPISSGGGYRRGGSTRRRMMHGGPHQMNTMDGGINNGNGNGHDRRRQSRDNMGRRK